MSKKPENVFRAKFDSRIKAANLGWFESIQQQAIEGTPDKLGCVNGHFVALEFKASIDAKVSELQKLKLARITENGGHAFLVYPENQDEVFFKLVQLKMGEKK